MEKLILKVCDAHHSGFQEPVFLESAHDLPMGMKQVMEDFMEAYGGEITTPLMITAHRENEAATPCRPVFGELAKEPAFGSTVDAPPADVTVTRPDPAA